MNKNNVLPIIIMMSLIFSINGQSKLEKHKLKAKKELEKRIETFVNDFNSGNGEGFADIFSEKLYNKTQKLGVVKNVEAVHKHYKVSYELDIDTLVVDNNMAYDKGKIITTLIPKSGKGATIKETNAYMEIWEKETDGKWRIIDAIKHKVEAPVKAATNQENLPEHLAKYVGDYHTGGPVFKILVSENKEHLMIFLDGQLDHKLSEQSKNIYTIDKAPGITVNFKEVDGKITELEFVQPTGSILAKRK